MKNVAPLGTAWHRYEHSVAIKMLLLIIHLLSKAEKPMMKILYSMKNDKSHEVFDFGMSRQSTQRIETWRWDS